MKTQFFLCLVIAVAGCTNGSNYSGKPYTDAEYKTGMQIIPGRVYGAYFDVGGEGIAYHDTDEKNNGSGALNALDGSYLHSFRVDESVDISYTKTNDIDDSEFNFVEPPMNVLYVGWTEPGEWTKYTVKVEKTGKYRVGLMYTSNRGGKISLSVNDQDATGALDVPSTYRDDDPVDWRQWHHWNKIDGIAEIFLKKGVQTLTLHTVEQGQMNYMWLDFEWIGNVYTQNEQIITNPIDLNYRFQRGTPSYRESADPVCEYFKGKYYLFASVSGGYWSSPDLANWTYIPSKTIGTIENYAPAILVLDDVLCYLASGDPVRIYKNANPDEDAWELMDTQFHFPMAGNTDPAFFRNDDGRVYIYWGCSDKTPIVGVEADPKNGFKTIGEPVVLIEHQPDLYGWEVPGENNDHDINGWNEGPAVIKHNGKYYLQYAAPGTEFRTYGDGVYVGDHPLGPFRYVERNPFSFKPGGFIGGTGHGHIFKDKYGNYWHVSTMRISVRFKFERRLGLFPLHIDKDGNLIQQSVWSDYPFAIPNKKTDFKEDVSTGWHLLSYHKPATASSSLHGFSPCNAADEKVETWWSAITGHAGEWFQVDLQGKKEIRAIQVNFADQDFNIQPPHDLFFYQYIIEASDDGENWKTIIDKSNHSKDAVHELIVLDKPIETRYLRISNTRELPGKFSLYDFRVFGKGKGDLPAQVTDLKVIRNSQDTRRYHLTWANQEKADGYIVNVFLENGPCVASLMVHDNTYEGGFFNRDSGYYFTVDAFNANGVTKGVKKIAESKEG